jgi:UDP-2,3-diacylglucosamine pyrophosphatase LpxH
MSRFKFVHSADLHLDSPLVGLAGKSPDFAARVDRASRQAFDNLVALVIDEGARFLVLAGDVFDGDLRNFQTGLYFLDGMGRLARAGVRVFMIAGNHDAENRFAARLAYNDCVHVMQHRRAESVALDDLGVVVHGRSFGQREVTENIARDYPPAVPGRFNVGVLHTACEGSEAHHACYAPCTTEQLVNHGYEYWALGHVHARAVLNEHPHVVYPGNLQGRNPREVGPKGATVVEVEEGRIIGCEHRDLDVVRWAVGAVDLSGVASRHDAVMVARNVVDEICRSTGDRALALRLSFRGASAAHGEFLRYRAQFREDVEAMLAGMPGDVWLEKIEIRTTALPAAGELDPTVSGRLREQIVALGPGAAASLEDSLAELRAKIPAAAKVDELFDRLRREAPARALDLALSLVADEG